MVLCMLRISFDNLSIPSPVTAEHLVVATSWLSSEMMLSIFASPVGLSPFSSSILLNTTIILQYYETFWSTSVIMSRSPLIYSSLSLLRPFMSMTKSSMLALG